MRLKPLMTSSGPRILAVRLDLAHLHLMRQETAPEFGREDYPEGFEPGSKLNEPERSAVAAFVDTFGYDADEDEKA